MIVPLPRLLLYLVLLLNAAYFLLEFPANSLYGYTLGLSYASNVTAYYLSTLLAATLKSEAVALAIFPVLFVMLSQFAGFSIKLPDVPDAWVWATYVSFPRWVYEGQMVAFIRSSGFSGDQVDASLEYFGFKHWSPELSPFIALAFAAFFAALTYWNLRPPKDSLVKVDDVDTIMADSRGQDQEMEEVALLNTYNPLNSPSSEREGASPTSSQDYKPFTVEDYRAASTNAPRSRGCRLMFHDLTYSVPDRKDRRRELKILRGVSGRTQPGEVCALMGASGAGKSTLLDVLAGRKTTGTIGGDLLFNGRPRGPSVIRTTAYVLQDNVHIGVLTVRQTLSFAADLRVGTALSKEEREARVEQILSMLGLTEVAETIIGTDTLRGISGGQLKRVSIGVEIIMLPDLIFLDEPTSGLDSAIALEVMSAVRNLADQNRTIMCTIHQPSAGVYALFDKLLLMSEGKVIYFGPAIDAVPFFTSSPFAFTCASDTNPADFVIDVAGGSITSSTGKVVPGEELVQYYSKSVLNRMFEEHFNTMVEMDVAAAGSVDDKKVTRYPTSMVMQFHTLLRRQALTFSKDRKPHFAALIRNVVLGLFYGSLFYHLGVEDTSDKLSLFFFTLSASILGHNQSIPGIFMDRLLFYRERGANAVATLPYWAVIASLKLPLTALNALVYCSIITGLSNLRTEGDAFAYLFTVVLLQSFVGLFQCQLISTCTSSPQSALSVANVASLFTIAFSGYLVFIPTLPDWLRSWAPYASFMRWAFEGLVTNEMGDDEDNLVVATTLDNLGFHSFDKWQVIPILVGFAAGMRLLTLVALRFVSFEER